MGELPYLANSIAHLGQMTDDLYDLFPLNGLELSRQIYDLAHVARWGPYNLYDLQ